MALTKVQKQKILEGLKEKIAKQKAIVFVDLTGLKVKDSSVLRKKIKTEGNDIKVAKKTLIKLALKSAGLDMDIKGLKGEIAMVFGLKDEITPAKTVWQFSKENPNLKILAGILENKIVTLDKVIELAQLPTKEGLLGRLVGSVAAPMSGFMNVLQGNIKGLIYALSAIKK